MGFMLMSTVKLMFGWDMLSTVFHVWMGFVMSTFNVLTEMNHGQ